LVDLNKIQSFVSAASSILIKLVNILLQICTDASPPAIVLVDLLIQLSLYSDAILPVIDLVYFLQQHGLNYAATLTV